MLGIRIRICIKYAYTCDVLSENVDHKQTVAHIRISHRFIAVAVVAAAVSRNRLSSEPFFNASNFSFIIIAT